MFTFNVLIIMNKNDSAVIIVMANVDAFSQMRWINEN